MFQRKILVPLGSSGKDLKSVHHALALAERIEAQVYILQQDDALGCENTMTFYMGEALSDLINSARQAGLRISHHIGHKEFKDEIIDLVRAEGIDLIVFRVAERVDKRLLVQIKPLVSSQIIEVKSKDRIS